MISRKDSEDLLDIRLWSRGITETNHFLQNFAGDEFRDLKMHLEEQNLSTIVTFLGDWQVTRVGRSNGQVRIDETGKDESTREVWQQ